VDKGTPEKVIPTYSAKDKVQVVNTVISSIIQVKSFSRVTQLLRSEQIHPIHSVGHSERISSSSTFSWEEPRYQTVTDDGDAEGYFNYLRLIVSGALDASPDKVKTAYDQLFAFVYAMGSDIQIVGEHPIFTYKTLEQRLQPLDSKLTDLQSKILNFDNTLRKNTETVLQETQKTSKMTDAIDDLKGEISSLESRVSSLEDTVDSDFGKITEILKRLDEWLRLFTPTLERAKSEYEEYDRRLGQPEQKRGN
jgi:gas vesicle protein